MTFLNFIDNLPMQEDIQINLLLQQFKNDKEFPNTDNIDTIARYLYLQLDYPKTLAFQKLLMLWFYAKNNFQQPSDPSTLNKINLIVDLQNSDKKYKFR